MAFYQINRLNLGKPEANSSGLLQDLRVQSTAPPDPKRQSVDSAGISIAESHNGSQSGSNFDLLHEDASRYNSIQASLQLHISPTSEDVLP
ncbi:hypothetical protein EGR_08058 [Echinococcus granulosus]|uniref:Uncharacterized protein n=1 Tax=Echinococcus granulosus TaxID=6210 RepID=W6U7G5_ECHGR|nr:hypothetical protein EGR_08058 [Echinococcus granulosus]EUB57110.1 hypothetical protein EGR_08058 [Echinococcus granulosus]